MRSKDADLPTSHRMLIWQAADRFMDEQENWMGGTAVRPPSQAILSCHSAIVRDRAKEEVSTANVKRRTPGKFLEPCRGFGPTSSIQTRRSPAR